nr:amidase family protein [Halococcus thailandensis]
MRNSDQSSLELVKRTLDCIAAYDELNAFITVTDQSARERARKADAAAARDVDLGRFHGDPIASRTSGVGKAGIRHTMGLALLAENIAQTDSISINPLGGVTCAL